MISFLHQFPIGLSHYVCVTMIKHQIQATSTRRYLIWTYGFRALEFVLVGILWSERTYRTNLSVHIEIEFIRMTYIQQWLTVNGSPQIQ